MTTYEEVEANSGETVFYDFTPESYKEEPVVCGQCGNYFEHVVDVYPDEDDGELRISWTNWLSCTSPTIFYGSDEEFLREYYENTSLYSVDYEFKEELEGLIERLENSVRKTGRG